MNSHFRGALLLCLLSSPTFLFCGPAISKMLADQVVAMHVNMIKESLVKPAINEMLPKPDTASKKAFNFAANGAVEGIASGVTSVLQNPVESFESSLGFCFNVYNKCGGK